MKKDRFLHIFAGAFIAAVVGMPSYLDSDNLFAGLWSAGVSGLVAGGIKEWCDNKYDWEWSWADLGWTALGAVLAMLFILFLHIGKG